MATTSTATENPIASTSVTIDIEAPIPADATAAAATSTTAAATTTTTPSAPTTTPDGGKSKAPAPKKNYRHVQDDYKIACCGNSWLDLFLVPLTAIVLYGAMIGLSLLVLWAVFLTSTTNTAHWIFFAAWLLGVISVIISVQVAEYETYLKAQQVKKQASHDTIA
ncbi:hypothetical protein H257_11241 [Aphanomyces astaci]|uniref:Uncharacterized protein n=1 Tax=Aphanomyces astaci TaxID=112090 RepID=W4G3Q2_APHAT|nr:hypothetical protein H257_11241 [Aphanomyces astaci]ETV73916.1 hypothetical protein H257_11241 [Aphanomyces astaci]RQM23670.1 hypothetical protein B5M09_003292 [Aphanomyces astaci]|eukprot:XP_009836429.1 hypothetical protein H257_11241 [Aphanomyces astaci]